MDRGTCQATVHGVAKELDTTELKLKLTSALGTLGLMNHIKLNSHVCHCVPHCTQRLVLIWEGALNIK